MGGAVVGSAEHMNEVLTFLRTCGPTMSAFNAWVFLKGLETLRLRMEAHSRSALELASWLRSSPRWKKFIMPGWRIIPAMPWHVRNKARLVVFCLSRSKAAGMRPGTVSTRLRLCH